MSWLQLRVHVPEDRVAHAESLMEELGAVSVTLQDQGDRPELEPLPGTIPLWPETSVVGLFEAESELQYLLDGLIAGGFEAQSIEHEHLADRVWEREWMQHFRPARFGERLWIVPGDEPDPCKEGVFLRLDPGLAFGTGSHPTTALCLRWLDARCTQGKTVLDFGCGSGILGLAARMLGARHVDAVDIDEQALIATRENALRNGISDICCMLPGDRPSQEYDIVIANILFQPLLELAADLAAATRPGGSIVLSGVLTEQAGELEQCYTTWFRPGEVEHLDGWACWTGTRRDSPPPNA